MAKRPLKKAASNTGRSVETDLDDLEEEEQNEADLANQDDEPGDDEPGGEEETDNNPTTMGDEPDPEEPPLTPVDDYIPGAPKDGRTFRAGQPVIFKGEKRGGNVVALENVYRATQHPTSSRTRFFQLLVRGSEVPAAKVRELSDGNYESDQL
jgi:hypothetical protein